MPSGKTKSSSIYNPLPPPCKAVLPQYGSTALDVPADALFEQARQRTSAQRSPLTDTVTVDDEILEAAAKDGVLEK